MSDRTDIREDDGLADDLQAMRELLTTEHRAMDAALQLLSNYAVVALFELHSADGNPQQARLHLETLLQLMESLRNDLAPIFQSMKRRKARPGPDIDEVYEWGAGTALAAKLRVALDRDPKKDLLLGRLEEVIPGLGSDIPISGRLRSFCDAVQEQLLERPTVRRTNDA